MPDDHLTVLRRLSSQLGREPSLQELVNAVSSGSPTQVLPETGLGLASLRSDEAQAGDDARITAELRLREMMDTSPLLVKVREEMAQRMLGELLMGPSQGEYPWLLRLTSQAGRDGGPGIPLRSNNRQGAIAPPPI